MIPYKYILFLSYFYLKLAFKAGSIIKIFFNLKYLISSDCISSEEKLLFIILNKLFTVLSWEDAKY